MSDKTSIEWTEATFNPWWGCTKVSPGCDHCYAEGVAKRFAPGIWGAGAPRREFTEEHWDKPVQWNTRAMKAGKRLRVFCASMADVFDNDAPDGAREMLWELIERTPYLDWQVLTKRVGNVRWMVPEHWMGHGFPPNVWLGVTVVNQEEADRDIPKLLELPARIRWLSCEPLLGPIDVARYVVPWNHAESRYGVRVDWVVAGGESGRHARPMHPDWARQLRDQCIAAGVPFLFKQWGEFTPNRPDPLVVVPNQIVGVIRNDDPFDAATMLRLGKKAAGRTLDGRTWDEYPA